MFIEIERYVKFITKHNLTQPQFLFLYLMYRKRFDLMREYMNTFPSDDGSFLGKINRNDLILRGFIIKVGEGESAADFTIGEDFKKIFIDRYEAGREVFEKYPPFMLSDGKRYPLTAMDTYEFSNLYAERIGYDQAEHEEVKKDLDYAIENNLISCKLETFVKSEQWRSFRKLRNVEPNTVVTSETHF